MTMAVPNSPEAEWSVVGQILTKPDVIAQVIGAQAESVDFFRPDTRLIFEAAVETHYAGDRVDPVTVAERLRAPLARQWNVPEDEVPTVLHQQATSRAGMDSVIDHLQVVKRLADQRRLLAVIQQAERAISQNTMSPEEVGDFISTETMQIVTGTKRRSEILDMRQVASEYVKYLKKLRAAREQGIELAVYTGFKFWDTWTKGLAPTELMIVGGPPGVGKSALVWEAGRGFATRQMKKVKEKRVGTLVLSMEMGQYGSSGRVTASIAKMEGDRLREGIVRDDELAHIIKAWRNNLDLPIYWNFASNFRFSQMRALVVEAIRKYNVGLVIVDHFRMFDPDRRINNANQEDEAKARFLKEDIAKDLNVAVIVLAHTVKMRRDGDMRPTLDDLRGSGQVAAHADIVAFMFSPYMYATDEEKLNNVVKPDEAELLFRKNRNGALGTSDFGFEAALMTVRDAWTR